MNIYVKTAVVLALLAVQACSTNTMKRGGYSQASVEGRATIVFMRWAFALNGQDVDVFEISDDDLSYVGAVRNKRRVVHRTTPGKKIFMTRSSATDFMIANVEANKTYYVILRPNYLTGAFAPTPVRADGTTNYNMDISEFSSWRSETISFMRSPAAQGWFEKKKAKYRRIYQKRWPKFNKKSDSQKAERTLRPEDGIFNTR